MKSCTPEFAAHLAENVTTLATCWKVTRVDGETYGFTDHVSDLIVDGQLMKANAGYTRTAIASNSALSVDNMDLEGLIAGAGITEEDCRVGLFDYAEVQVMLVNFADMSMGKLILRRGFLGELSLMDGIFTTEIRGLAQLLSRKFMDIVTYDCRVHFGSAECGVDAGQFASSGTITGVLTERRVFTTDLTEDPHTFTGGIITFTSGDAAGRSMEVKVQGGNLPMVAGDTAVHSAWTGTAGGTFVNVTTGTILITTGLDGRVTVAAIMTGTQNTSSNRKYMYSKWEYRPAAGGTWVSGPIVKSHQEVGIGYDGNMDMTHNFDGLTPETEYEFRLMGRKSSSGDNTFYWNGTANFYAGMGSALADPNSNRITLFLPMNWDINVGDTFDIVRGCLKTPDACKSFNNFVNYRGFPHVPGMDAILRTPEYRPPDVS